MPCFSILSSSVKVSRIWTANIFCKQIGVMNFGKLPVTGIIYAEVDDLYQIR